MAYQISRFFGTTAAENAPWDPASLAPRIQPDVLLFREDDDAIVSRQHNLSFAADRITTQSVDLAAGGDGDGFVHGTTSADGRHAYRAAISAFAERAITARRGEFTAAKLRCKGSNRTVREIAVAKVRTALRCLARKDKTDPPDQDAGRRRRSGCAARSTRRGASASFSPRIYCVTVSSPFMKG